MEDLVPQYAYTVPADLFDGGKPIKYRLTEDGAIVYSVGCDGTDDGGRELDPDGNRLLDGTDLSFTIENVPKDLLRRPEKDGGEN